MRVVDEPDPTLCTKCGKKFATTGSLVRHQKGKACNQGVYVDKDPSCPFCGENFSRLDNRKRHEKICPVRNPPPEKKTEGDKLAEAQAEIIKLRAIIAAKDAIIAPPKPAAPVAVAAGGAGGSAAGRDVIHNTSHDININIHVHGSEEVKFDERFLRLLEYEMRTRALDPPDSQLYKLHDRLAFRLYQESEENQTVRSYDRTGDTVGVHVGDGKWEKRRPGRVAREHLDRMEKGPLRKLRASGSATGLVKSAVEKGGTLSAERRHRWETLEGRTQIITAAVNNEKRAMGEDVPVRPA
jgi:hypothetical protein